ncbi:MAG TPA: prenyltransferase/squalene oxidase repeat-containing protein [Pirellulales bacterium]|nr:prenyltransferase/squalene oxidase repeat-containing protein [Pirellulales bacterium]
MVDYDKLCDAYRAARELLLGHRNGAGHWEGQLSSSALSTATAVSALALVRRQLERDDSAAAREQQERIGRLIFGGLDWLVQRQNADGGWGDTDRSSSNIATTMLVRAAFQLTCVPANRADLLSRADLFIQSRGGIPGLRRRYGRDKTFAVPILTNCALAGLVSWKEVSSLPFELACFPQSWFRFLQLPVVSYAIPALVAIGQARYFHGRPLNPLVRWWRAAAVEKSLRVLEQMQPASGGFLEATPLTSFVVMSLASIGQARHPVARRGLDFILSSVRDDGSWPIDTNLATWVTTLSLNALDVGGSAAEARERCAPWLLDCQSREVHPYTGAAPGGWGWSDLSGSVPDADDSSGALLTLASLTRGRNQVGAPIEESFDSARLGVGWLLDLQNSDGGWPTFCRGWGKLPFDRSGTDLTAHAIRALHAWRTIFGDAEDAQTERINRAISDGWRYLAQQQQPDGSWSPLWFGNEHHPREENPVYGTSRVLLAYADLGKTADPAACRGLAWLAARQRSDGAWGLAPSVEETALAVEAMLAAGGDSAYDQHVERGLGWLIDAVESGRLEQASPIGFYFAKLWYYEKLYPVIFTVAALGRGVRRLDLRSGLVPIPAECPTEYPADCRVDRRARPPKPTLTPAPAHLG